MSLLAGVLTFFPQTSLSLYVLNHVPLLLAVPVLSHGESLSEWPLLHSQSASRGLRSAVGRTGLRSGRVSPGHFLCLDSHGLVADFLRGTYSSRVGMCVGLYM